MLHMHQTNSFDGSMTTENKQWIWTCLPAVQFVQNLQILNFCIFSQVEFRDYLGSSVLGCGKPIVDWIILYNKVSLNIDIESTEKTTYHLFSTTQYRSTPPVQTEPHEYPHKVYLPETRIPNLHFAGVSIVYLHSIFLRWAPKNPLLWSRAGNSRSRSPKVVDLGMNRKHVCNFLLVINSNLGLIFSRFRDIAGFLLKQPTRAYSTRNLGKFPLD